ncbi:MAG: alpha/beta hydrolase [Pseudomonadales bacterium]|nr:alpha/beta hydrolase [Pseudomonadales bacterium]
MPIAKNGNCPIYYEVTIDNDGPTLVLIAGLGEQIGAIEYPMQQCELFGNAGFRVVRIDNRETGLSGPDADSETVPFTLLDMADDVAAVINDLGGGPAHVLGASLGGFIARWLVIRHPELTLSLTVVMSGCGASPDEDGPQIEAEVREKNSQVLAALPKDQAIENLVAYWRWLWGNSYPFPEEFIRERLAYCYDRAYRPEGIGRQLQAAISTPGLWEAQTQIQIPTLVLHGGEDPYFSLTHGEAIAQRIGGAKFWADPRMGHIMHQEQWEELAQRVKALAGT